MQYLHIFTIKLIHLCNVRGLLLSSSFYNQPDCSNSSGVFKWLILQFEVHFCNLLTLHSLTLFASNASWLRVFLYQKKK